MVSALTPCLNFLTPRGITVEDPRCEGDPPPGVMLRQFCSRSVRNKKNAIEPNPASAGVKLT
jgi:hypothetical protein